MKFQRSKIKEHIDLPVVYQEKPGEVPPKFCTKIDHEWFRTFSFWDRVKILFGANLQVVICICTEHRPGRFQFLVGGTTSNHTSAVNHLKAQIKEAMDKKQKVP